MYVCMYVCMYVSLLCKICVSKLKINSPQTLFNFFLKKSILMGGRLGEGGWGSGKSIQRTLT